MALDRELLGRGLVALGLPSEGRLAEGLARYGAEIELWNPAYGLVGAEGDELVIKHLLDSLAPLALLRAALASIAAGRAEGRADGRADSAAQGPVLAQGPVFSPLPLRLADLGSGAGLPGIPLALALPEVEVSLVERMGKRSVFLEAQKALLRLDNAVVLQKEVEQVRERFEILTFRAFRPFERKLFKAVFSLCEDDGLVAAYKGRREKVEAELPAIEGLFSSCEILPVKVPFLDEERCLVLLRPARK
jgi:16S rRNA (guanine527-N7)-methyltransferase